MNQTTNSDILIRVQGTPNPNAWKFVLDRAVLTEGKATYASSSEAINNNLAYSLFHVPDVKQVHFFQNVITITHTFDADPEEVQRQVCAVIQTRMPVHNPNQTIKDEKRIAREKLPPEIQKMEEILDETVRPGLQGDGGDIEIIKYEDHKLYVSYQGACGSCPSSTTGTLMYIEGMMKERFDPDIEVIPV